MNALRVFVQAAVNTALRFAHKSHEYKTHSTAFQTEGRRNKINTLNFRER